MDLAKFKTVEELAAVMATLLEEQMSTNKGWIGAAWQKDPLRLGYSGDKTEEKSELSASAGSNTLTGAVVPAGEIWIVQAIAARDVDNAPSSVLLYVTVNSIQVILKTETTPVTNIWVSWTGEIILSEGDGVRAVLNGCTLNDDIFLRYHGIRVDIDQ